MQCMGIGSSMNILITGARGQLGRAFIKELLGDVSLTLTATTEDGVCELRELIKPFERNFNNTEIKKIDFTNEIEVIENLGEYKFDVIINCLAMTAVDCCEDDKDRAYKLNGLVPKNLVKLSKKLDSLLVHISTDYVFNGGKNVPYLEDDIPFPINEYGKSKLLGEEYIIKELEKYIIVRTAWLYGDGKNFVRTMLKLTQNTTEISVVGDQIGTPTSTKFVAKAVTELILNKQTGIWNVVCRGRTSWYGFAKKIMEILENDVRVIKIGSDEYKTRAKRPKFSVLSIKKLSELTEIEIPTWEEALYEYLKTEEV